MKWYTCHWSDGHSKLSLGLPVKASEAKLTQLPFVLCQARNARLAQSKVDEFNRRWAGSGSQLSEGMNSAHIPLAELRLSEFFQGHEV